MPLLPAALSFDEVGGEKQQFSPITNYNYDYSNDDLNNACAGITQASRTVLRGFVRFVSGSSPTFATSNYYESVWRGNTTTEPILNHTTTGVITITLPATVLDPLGNTIVVSLRGATVQIEGNGAFGFAQCTVTSANVITVYLANSSASPNDLSGSTVGVYFV